MVRFIGRVNELDILNADWNKSDNGFIVVYGRRRVGKTRLLDEFTKGKKGIKYTAEDTNSRIQIKEMKTIFAKEFNDEFMLENEFQDWSSLFDYLTKVLKKNEKQYIWIDEFSYLVKNHSSVTSVIQKFIDFFVRKSKLFLIVSGSLFGLMEEKVLSHSSPLYGRRTRAILLKAISEEYCHKFLNMNNDDKFKTVLTIGGIPEYLLVASKYKTYKSFIEEEFFKEEGYFYRETHFLLSQEFKEIKTYFSILNAIAYGNTKPSEIANFAGLHSREIYPYLELLINYGFVKREVPMFESSKRGIYIICDEFFDFWFNFVYKNRQSIGKRIYSIEENKLNSYFGKRFEIFIRDIFHLFFERIKTSGRWWQKEKEIDIVAVTDTKTFLGECKWKENVDSEKILGALKEKSREKDFGKTINYVIFAKSFTKETKLAKLISLKKIQKTLKY